MISNAWACLCWTRLHDMLCSSCTKRLSYKILLLWGNSFILTWERGSLEKEDLQGPIAAPDFGIFCKVPYYLYMHRDYSYSLCLYSLFHLLMLDVASAPPAIANAWGGIDFLSNISCFLVSVKLWSHQHDGLENLVCFIFPYTCNCEVQGRVLVAGLPQNWPNLHLYMNLPEGCGITNYQWED